MEHVEHVLKRPDLYVGSCKQTTESLWVIDEDSERMTFREITFSPALYKIFDEILVNAADNKQRSDEAKVRMSYIKVVIDEENNEISISNDGISKLEKLVYGLSDENNKLRHSG